MLYIAKKSTEERSGDYLSPSLYAELKDKHIPANLTIQDLTFWSFPENQVTDTQYSKEYCVLHVVSGTAEIQSDDHHYPIESGYVVYIEPNTHYRFSTMSGTPLHCQVTKLQPYTQHQQTPFKNFMAANERYREEARKSALFELVRTHNFAEQKNLDRLRLRLAQWSHIFQLTMMSRQLTTQEKNFQTLFREHLEEEFGHDKLLPIPDYWDAQIDAYGNWFVLKMLQLDNLEKLVIMHMVIENAADDFLPLVKEHSQSQDPFFTTHADLDEDHASMGNHFLEKITEEQSIALQELVKKSWSMMTLLLNRIAFLTKQDIEQGAQEKTAV